MVFSIDDLGTGYSSLAYLKHLPVAELKIDRSFVMDLPGDVSDAAVVQLILSLGSQLVLRVVAEGVESREQLDYLRSHGCSVFQGYLFTQPRQIDDWFALQAQKAKLQANPKLRSVYP